jgi:hypothetical protein
MVMHTDDSGHFVQEHVPAKDAWKAGALIWGAPFYLTAIILGLRWAGTQAWLGYAAVWALGAGAALFVVFAVVSGLLKR